MKIYIALAAFPFLAFATPSMAQNRVDLGAQALSNIRGSMGVNMVAGNMYRTLSGKRINNTV
ncbi:hypothetical protein KAM342_28840 [Aeromonas caviae]|uniref:Uncharacterized protein n=1 Tax=Aeromonas caviae TaxID=648 RepID=A0AAV4YMQ8_AERCA|nr:hypothetical protein [Aeromonas caviae]BCM76545.1 hypothetical protein KAM329_030930 [Aeromonas caviae]GJA34328.1 hypothetical protein KAM341_40060 [Aeromonas caviae]GJA37641.1 hypothetical protein KAM342_28840 [Aeromonas caviae]GJA42204.1 hypothetical protein KAM343_30000 [Aeromonas caviae]GJA78046.1 hypothetical protein KAM354_32820 [Aeromonas caviae]